MNSHDFDYLDGNAAAGELNSVFTTDVAAAQGQCTNCGAIKPFAEAHLYMQCPGFVARCPACENVLLRFVNVRGRVFLDIRGMTYWRLDAPRLREPA